MNVAEYDLEHPMPMHRAIAAFVADVVAERPEVYTGGFGYQINVYKKDGTSVPFNLPD